MKYQFTNWAKSNLPSVIDNSFELKLTLFVRSAIFDNSFFDETGDISIVNYSYISELELLSELEDCIGWQVATGIQDTNGSKLAHISVEVGTSNTQVSLLSPFLYSNLTSEQIYAEAFAISLSKDSDPDDGKLLCVFQLDEPPLISGSTNDFIFTSIGFKSEAFTFLNSVDPVNGESCDPHLGELDLSIPVGFWEPARSAHIWMEPQRINFAVNSSFESIDENNQPYGWRSNATSMNVVSGGSVAVPSNESVYNPLSTTNTRSVLLRGDQSVIVMESLPFPASTSKSKWTIRASVQGTGQVRIGIVMWSQELDPADIVYNCSDWIDISAANSTAASATQGALSGAFTDISVLVNNADRLKEAQFRLEFEPDTSDTDTALWVDNVLVESSESLEEYFDAESGLGMSGDFYWYGNGVFGNNSSDYNTPHKSFSIFYNNKKNLENTIFGYLTEESDGTTVEIPGIADYWVPQGTSFITHWDDVFRRRERAWVADAYIPVIDFTDKTTVNTLV